MGIAEQPPPPATFSNGVRLRGRQWLGVTLFGLLLMIFAPQLWKQLEHFELQPDYRISHDLSNDYWLYRRFVDLAAERYDRLILGDSVVWGEYVTREQTLSHYLNVQTGSERYANLGLDGAHPLALGGLIEHYAGSIAGKNVVLHCNPLWLSSAKADLQDDTVRDFNHPRLVPQFVPRIPGYKEEISYRIGVLVEQRLPFNQWTNHLQQAYYDHKDIPSWTVDETATGREGHPYDNPLEPLGRGLPAVDDSLRHLPQPWHKRGKRSELMQDFPWVDLESSLQWHAFQRVLEILQKRGNRVFVLVGPFNEHMLTPASHQRYQQIKAGIAAWLESRHVPHAVPPPLSTDQYGDASHPLAEGYAALARELMQDAGFTSRR
jgi:hypothetical protein